MNDNDFNHFKRALIVGAGAGLSASLARTLAGAGLKVALASRSTSDLEALAAETGAKLYTCDAAKSAEVEKLFSTLDSDFGAPDVVVYNASAPGARPVC